MAGFAPEQAFGAEPSTMAQGSKPPPPAPYPVPGSVVPGEAVFGPTLSVEPHLPETRRPGDYKQVTFRVEDKLTAAKEAKDQEFARREGLKLAKTQSDARYAEYKALLEEARGVLKEPLPKAKEFQADEADLITGGLAALVGVPGGDAAAMVYRSGNERMQREHQEALANFELRRGNASDDIRIALDGARFEQNLGLELEREARLRDQAVEDRELAWKRHTEEIDRENGEWRARAQISFDYDKLGKDYQAKISKELAQFEADIREKFQVNAEARADGRAEVNTYRGALVDAESEQSVRGAIQGLRSKGIEVPPAMASAFTAAGRKKDDLRQQQVNLEVKKTNAQIAATEAGVINDNRRIGIAEEEFIRGAGGKGPTEAEIRAERETYWEGIRQQRALIDSAKQRKASAETRLKKNSFDKSAEAEHKQALDQIGDAERKIAELRPKAAALDKALEQVKGSSGMEGAIGDARVRIEENRERSGMAPFKVPGLEDGKPNAEMESDRKQVLERIKSFQGNPAKQAEYRKWFKDKYGRNP